MAVRRCIVLAGAMSGDSKTVTVLGVPNSAGAYCVGVEEAPAALRASGLINKLGAAGADVRDVGDLTLRRWRPDRASPRVQNLADEIEALLELASAGSSVLEQGSRLLVLGGSCLVAVGFCAAIAEIGERPRLIYVDRHLDLNTPDSTVEGSLSWMGMAHALQVEGSAPQLAGAAKAVPLLTAPDLVYLGVDLSQATDWERDQVRDFDLSVVPQHKLVSAPADAALEALSLLSAGPFAVHVDVDVLDFIDAPLAENVNGRNSGPTIEQLGAALAVLLDQPQCWGLSIGQLVPAHAASDATVLSRLTTTLAAAFTTAATS